MGIDQCRRFVCADDGVVDPTDHSICYKKMDDGVIKVGSCGKIQIEIL